MIALPMDSKGRYTKFPQGKTEIRFLTEPIPGFQVWIEENGKRKPVRCKAIEVDTGLTDSKGNKIYRSEESQVLPTPVAGEYKKFILVALVWNYNTEQIEVFVVDKSTIWRPLAEYNNHKDWGSPVNYNITITRVGEGREKTKYSVIPSPAKPLDKEIEKRFKEEKKNIDLEKIFTGENPFSATPSNAESIIDPDDIPF